MISSLPWFCQYPKRDNLALRSWHRPLLQPFPSRQCSWECSAERYRAEETWGVQGKDCPHRIRAGETYRGQSEDQGTLLCKRQERHRGYQQTSLWGKANRINTYDKQLLNLEYQPKRRNGPTHFPKYVVLQRSRHRRVWPQTRVLVLRETFVWCSRAFLANCKQFAEFIISVFFNTKKFKENLAEWNKRVGYCIGIQK